ncbi:hypothetical protein D7Y27_14505 [Corallococcus sp. AB004]|uniref:hypothetical protein n=1 Tax=Corallococcus exiguus TaxID=83462 RepID=UPI000EA2C109|nr:hypothetical protein [Corallococcus exiguus]NPC68222.1 hypothetical protein [Corallococcus exiguus]NPD25257.1 hypothetical protein [Corallococcus exiguus]RKI43863.1 hypothetical protein D7Y27_14505 [Corallococcus sp. AB004]
MSSLRALALLATLALAPASALAEPEDAIFGMNYVFTSVDAYTAGYGHFVVTGVVAGESTPRVIRFSGYGLSLQDADRCDRFALIAMTRPGRYQFSYFQEAPNQYPTCTLTRM